MIIRILTLLIVISSSLILQADVEVTQSPFLQGDFDYTDIIMHLFPNSIEIPNNTSNPSEMFQIPSKQEIEQIYNNAVQYFFRMVGEVEPLFYNSFRDLLNKNDEFPKSHFRFLDIDNDGVLEAFIRSYTPWGGGTSFIMYWKKIGGVYKYQNAFYGNFNMLNVNSAQDKSFIVFNGFEGDSTIHQIQEVNLPSCEKNFEANFFRELSIPIETQPIPSFKFKTIRDSSKLRLWPEAINEGIYDKDHQNGSNGNIQSVFPSNILGRAYSKFIDDDKSIWYLVLLDTNSQLVDYIYWPEHKAKGFLLGWIDENSIENLR